MNHKPHLFLPTMETTKGKGSLFLVKGLLVDNKATQYFVKLHIIAGQMSTESMNNTDTFYTLTGRPGEILSGDKVRVSLMSTPRTELSTESAPTAGSLCLSKNFPA